MTGKFKLLVLNCNHLVLRRGELKFSMKIADFTESTSNLQMN